MKKKISLEALFYNDKLTLSFKQKFVKFLFCLYFEFIYHKSSDNIHLISDEFLEEIMYLKYIESIFSDFIYLSETPFRLRQLSILLNEKILIVLRKYRLEKIPLPSFQDLFAYIDNITTIKKAEKCSPHFSQLTVHSHKTFFINEKFKKRQRSLNAA